MQVMYDGYTFSGFSGNQTYTTELIRFLTEKYPHHTYRLLTKWGRKNTGKVFDELNPSIQASGILPPPLLLGKAFRTPVKALGNMLIRKAAGSADLYHATNPNHFPSGLRNGVVTLHDLIPLYDKPWTQDSSKQFYRNHIRSILNQARIIFTVSDHTASDALKYFPETEGRLITTPLAASLLFTPRPHDRELRKRYNAGDHAKPYMLYVGEIQPRKNIHGLLSAYDNLPARQRSSVDLLIIGSVRTSYNKQYFEHALDRLGSRNGIYHLQNIPPDDLACFYSNAMLFIFPSFYEGFGLPVIEAMSCGCPVVTSSTTSLAEVAHDAAITVMPGEQEQLEQAISDMIDHEEWQSTYRQRGLQRAQSFSWTRTAELTMNGYNLALDT
ncbi:glycosyltransferase family 1 protein [Prosthecochloris sp. HL-130-GSB]|jgi:O-antigen biosynthesis alpha-1,3-mannosyltransferase|uniref:glycosyltransferase family 4 protein n=1 Tax=Prosthecochloris sp. HL-130-GSB TaxID=1974213 RepID=UPI000A1C000B|nr:glycosyltransferase family 1 protein [Prosthecochloris sp. HL-130-GSB]ARM30263.1 hypothetical protein B9H02_01635 [Prosthecochloris sp. HL-130-GSB]